MVADIMPHVFGSLKKGLLIINYNIRFELDLAFNNVKPKDWYFVLD